MKKILVVEDEAPVRGNILDLLNEEGYLSAGAENGARGVKLAREMLPDLILCDILMPGMDGYGVLATLSQEEATATIPFIFLTARTAREDVRQGMELSASDYITKPFSREDLLNAISTRLVKQKLLVDQVSQDLGQYHRDSQAALPYQIISPLMNILQVSDQMQTTAQEQGLEVVKTWAGKINQSARELLHTVRVFLLLAEVDAKRIDPPDGGGFFTNGTPAASRLVTETVIEVAREYDHLGELELDLEEAGINLPELQLQMMIEELADIAFRLASKGIRVVINGEKDPIRFIYHLKVCIPGTTLPAETTAYLNNPVIKLHSLPDGPVSGVGWLLARRLVELYKGEMTLDSTPDNGTAILITLPLL